VTDVWIIDVPPNKGMQLTVGAMVNGTDAPPAADAQCCAGAQPNQE
jgi:hypothetical protein